MRPDYDDYADVYDQIQSSEIAEQNLPFYVDQYVSARGPVLELGIGTGRIAIEAAKRGKQVIGIDNSLRMLDRCRERAAEAGVADRLHLIRADLREFSAPQPVSLAAMPFHTITDIVSTEDKRKVLRRVMDALRPGGRFIFDYFAFDPELAGRFNNVPHLEAEYRDEATGNDVLFWACGLYDYEKRTIRTISWTDEVDGDGLVVRRRYRRYESSWIETDEMGEMLEAEGFVVEALAGDFAGNPATPDSAVNVWVARRPE